MSCPSYYLRPLREGEIDQPVDYAAMARDAEELEATTPEPFPGEPAQVNLFTRELERLPQLTWEEALSKGEF